MNGAVIGSPDMILLASLLPLLILGIRKWPQRALMACFVLVLLANTKFRARDTGALLNGQADGQILFELGVYGVIGAIVIFNLLRLPAASLRPNGVELVLLGYIMLSLVSSLWSPAVEVTVVRASQLGILYLLAFVGVRVLTGPGMLKVVAVCVPLYVLLFASAALLIPGANGTRIMHTGGERFTWFAVHPIVAATFAATGAIFLISASSGDEKRQWFRYPIFCLVALLILIMLATRSRGPILAFTSAVLAISFLSLWKAQHGDFFRRAALFTFGTTGAGLFLLYHDVRSAEAVVTEPNRIIAYFLRGQTAEQFSSFSGRDDLWSLVFSLFAERPVIGHGYLASRAVLLERFPWAGTAHNGYFESLLNLGIVGAVLIVAPLLAVLVCSGGTLMKRGVSPGSGDDLMIFSGTIFLLVNSVSTESFAGFPGYEPMLLFVVVLAYFGRVRQNNMIDTAGFEHQIVACSKRIIVAPSPNPVGITHLWSPLGREKLH